MLNFIAVLLLGFAQAYATQVVQLPTIVADETQARPSRLITKTYVSKSPEFAFWSKRKDAGSERTTKLADAAIQIQQLTDLLSNHEGVDPDRQKNEAKLRELSDFLNEQQKADRVPVAVKFLTWTRAGNTNILNVKLYSDIPDQTFNRRIIEVIESRWQAPNFKVKLELKSLIGKPQDGAWLTAGAQTTHAELGHAIRLGPDKISENVLAHEFGHILGFRDLYYRAYRQLKDGTLEIQEVVPSTSDIMGNPEFGKVELRHFESLKQTNVRGK